MLTTCSESIDRVCRFMNERLLREGCWDTHTKPKAFVEQCLRSGRDHGLTSARLRDAIKNANRRNLAAIGSAFGYDATGRKMADMLLKTIASANDDTLASDFYNGSWCVVYFSSWFHLSMFVAERAEKVVRGNGPDCGLYYHTGSSRDPNRSQRLFARVHSY